MNAPVIRPMDSVPALAMPEEEIIETLQNSVYPGAAAASVKLVLNVCRASGKDPLKKPYHIVPMPVSTGQKDQNGYDIKRMRDVIMPGINDYRTDAARTGQHAGTTEPEFGPDVTATLDGVQITYPTWCRVTVYRQMPGGQVVAFTAKEFWVENYATKSNKSDAPNSMWRKRPYAQLAKCAEAQALRKGFPEVGAMPTADEMEGREIDMGSIEATAAPRAAVPPPAIAQLPDYSDEAFEANLPKWVDLMVAGKKTADQIIAMVSSKAVLSQEQADRIREFQPREIEQ